MDNNVDWILFFQTPFDTVKYMTRDMSTYSSMRYFKFLEFVMKSFVVKQSSDLRTELDKFSTIFLNCKTGEWKTIPHKEFKATFEELSKLNIDPEKATTLQKAKNTIETIFRQGHSKFLSR